MSYLLHLVIDWLQGTRQAVSKMIWYLFLGWNLPGSFSPLSHKLADCFYPVSLLLILPRLVSVATVSSSDYSIYVDWYSLLYIYLWVFPNIEQRCLVSLAWFSIRHRQVFYFSQILEFVKDYSSPMKKALNWGQIDPVYVSLSPCQYLFIHLFPCLRLIC